MLIERCGHQLGFVSQQYQEASDEKAGCSFFTQRSFVEGISLTGIKG